ncbi:alpha/beta fold hydrolase [Georgenia faecalis]|uniref:alpha/beta fold hydrolase n=1 Tax=Georgenia faecalis TaxID=2483799 RepID=UPI000FD940C6|nr:alpha/beta hydrolase [Georgenia faecalis]
MSPQTPPPSPPIVLVPGHWLGAWAWDAVAARLRATGHTVTALTLPGLEDAATPRAGIRYEDHVRAVLDAVTAHDGPVVLVAHSGAGAPVTSALDAAPERVARVVYVDSGPSADGVVPEPDLRQDAVELPLPSFAELEAGGASLAGLDAAALDRFRERAVPHPAGALRERIVLRDDRRHGVPATLVCCSIPSATVQALVASGEPMFAAVAALTDAGYVDLPTGHWPMWSAPAELADVLAGAAAGDA